MPTLQTMQILGTGIGKIWYRKKYRYRYRKYLVPEKSIGIVQHFGYRHTLMQYVYICLLFWETLYTFLGNIILWEDYHNGYI